MLEDTGMPIENHDFQQTDKLFTVESVTELDSNLGCVKSCGPEATFHHFSTKPPKLL